MPLELLHGDATEIDPISGTHRRPRRVAPERVLLIEADDVRALAWRKALAPSLVERVATLEEARPLLAIPRKAPDLLLFGCGIRDLDMSGEEIFRLFMATGLDGTQPIYVDARRCTMELAAALLGLGATVRSGVPWDDTDGDAARAAFINSGAPIASSGELYALAKTIAATEVATRYNLTGAHLELLRALLEEDHRRELAKLLGRSHGTVRVQLSQMRDRSHLTTAELVRETFGAAAMLMLELAPFRA
ncbi:MAG: hypothetical protein CMN30_29555 [Sandaracinus sp.]|nr:hypothetical protein [Sandaracinus sp.]|tara:strand:+ start:3648 stop:4391 length:744 start_codon:yes stop_codon:yes gene_type:complete